MKAVKDWQRATERLAVTFMDKYFPEHNYSDDAFWISDRIGDVFCVGQYFLDLNRMVEALELNATSDQLFDYYDLEVERAFEDPEKPLRVNFRNYVKYGMPEEVK